MRKFVALLLVITTLTLMSGVASAANGTIWPFASTNASLFQGR